jgi:hypothetical protein
MILIITISIICALHLKKFAAFSGAGYSKMPQVLAPALYAQVMLRHAIKRLSS